MNPRQFATSEMMEGRVRDACAGKPPVMRRMGLLVPDEQRMRVDGFIHILPEGSTQRRLALSAVSSIRNRHDNFSDEEFFLELRAQVWKERIITESGVLEMIDKLPLSQKGNALRVALNRKADDRSTYCNLEFYGNLISDAQENVPGEKQQEILSRLRGYARMAQERGALNRESVDALLYPFEEWLGKADIRSVNLLYYFPDKVEKLAMAALERPDFREFRTFIVSGLAAIADFEPANGTAPGMRAHYLEYAISDLRSGGVSACAATQERAGQQSP
jgi:hypothetical protein